MHNIYETLISNISYAIKRSLLEFNSQNFGDECYTRQKDTEKIMKMISKQGKKSLNEYTQNFDVTDYEDDENNLIDPDSIVEVIGKPKNYKEENIVFDKIIPSVESKEIVNQFINRLTDILNPLINTVVPDKVLKKNNGELQLQGAFSIISNFEDIYISEGFEYVSIYFNHYLNKKLELCISQSSIYRLAKMIEFCTLYNNELTFKFKYNDTYYHSDYYTKFINTVKNKKMGDIYEQRIYPKGFMEDDYKSGKNGNQINETFDWICEIYELFKKCYYIYLKEFDI